MINLNRDIFIPKNKNSVLEFNSWVLFFVHDSEEID